MEVALDFSFCWLHLINFFDILISVASFLPEFIVVLFDMPHDIVEPAGPVLAMFARDMSSTDRIMYFLSLLSLLLSPPIRFVLILYEIF